MSTIFDHQDAEKGQVYYFIDSAIHGTRNVRDEYRRVWINDPSIGAPNESNYYHHITKEKGDNFYKYFTTKEYKNLHSKPTEFVKLVHLTDAEKLGFKVYSQFSKVEQDERKHRRFKKMFGNLE